MGVAKMMATQEYTHAYRMLKSIAADNRTWVQFKSHFQEAYLDREDIEPTAWAAGYGSAKNLKHGEMEDAFMNFVLATVARDAAFTELRMTNGNF